MPSLNEIVNFCNERTRSLEIPDFPGAQNGLQFANRGEVTKVGAAVDAGLIPFREAVSRGVRFLIVHHGMFWRPFSPVTETRWEKVKTLMDGDCAVYGAHLPLDLHPEIGNNALLARQLALRPAGTFLEYEGNPIGTIAECGMSRARLRARLEEHYGRTFTAVEHGADNIGRVGILTGSGSSAVDHLRANGVDTLITGELKQNFFNQAQEEGLNLYCCGHYATEIHGVSALAREVSEKFSIPWEFIDTACPL